jgi:hypothetical protein
VEVGIFVHRNTPLMILVGLVGLLVAAYSDMLTLTSARGRRPLLTWLDYPIFPRPDVAPLATIQRVFRQERWLGLLFSRLACRRCLARVYDSRSIAVVYPSIFGVAVGGFAIRWAWPAAAFSIHVSAADRIEVSVLNRLARNTISSTFVCKHLASLPSEPAI